MDQCKKIESLEINPHTYGEARVYNDEKTVSSISGARKTKPAHVK